MGLHYEIVRILNGSSLIDCESYERRYRTPNGAPLAPGHYVVLWDDSIEAPAFDESATFVGPYKSSLLASLGLHRFLRSAPGHDGATRGDERMAGDMREGLPS